MIPSGVSDQTHLAIFFGVFSGLVICTIAVCCCKERIRSIWEKCCTCRPNMFVQRKGSNYGSIPSSEKQLKSQQSPPPSPSSLGISPCSSFQNPEEP